MLSLHKFTHVVAKCPRTAGTVPEFKPTCMSQNSAYVYISTLLSSLTDSCMNKNNGDFQQLN